jgi:toxin HigB-1
MIYYNQATDDIFTGENSKDARNLCPQSLWRIAFRKLDQLDSVETVDDLRVPQ